MMRILPLFLCICMCCITVTKGSAQGNPFTSARSASEGQKGLRAKVSGNDIPLPSFVSHAIHVVTRWQLVIRNTMADKADDIIAHPYGRSFWIFIALAFAYGFIHALGPGHGKVLAAGYFMTRPGRIWLGLLFGFLTMGFHVLSASVLVVGGYWLLGGGNALSGAGALYLEPVSFGLVACLGAFMIFDTLWDMLVAGKKELESSEGSSKGNGRLWAMALAAGLVPCPGAAMVLIFAVTLGIAHAGYAAMVAISLGMGLALSGVSVGTVLFRGAILATMTNHELAYRLLHRVLSLLGGLIVFFMGGILMLGSLHLG